MTHTDTQIDGQIRFGGATVFQTVTMKFDYEKVQSYKHNILIQIDDMSICLTLLGSIDI